MDSDTLYCSLDLVSGNGATLKSAQRAALQTSLLILKRNYKFTHVLLWGKILGIKNDYFIAQGVAEEDMASKTCLYSLNCMDWHLLPPATEELIAEVTMAAKGCFMGDPSHEYEHTETPQHGEGDETVEEEFTVKVNEEKRMAVTVFTIDKEVAVVPRGAYIKSPHGTMQTNRSFKGLVLSDAAKLHNYLHFSEPRNLKKQEKPGWWSLHFEQGSSVCLIRSLLWPGMTCFHMPLTPQHGYIYAGDGLKNLDLPFML